MLLVICYVANTVKTQMVQFCKLNALSCVWQNSLSILQVYAPEMQIIKQMDVL